MHHGILAVAMLQGQPRLQVTGDDVKAAWLDGQKRIMEAVLARTEARNTYEAHIQRRWWSARPVAAQQLLTWWLFLDAVQAEGDATATYGLFERCLVPCASYPGVFARCQIAIHVVAVSLLDTKPGLMLACPLM